MVRPVATRMPPYGALGREWTSRSWMDIAIGERGFVPTTAGATATRPSTDGARASGPNMGTPTQRLSSASLGRERRPSRLLAARIANDDAGL